MILFYGCLAYRPKPVLMRMILSGDRHRLCACGGFMSQWYNSTISSPLNHRRHPTFKLCDNPILSCQTKNTTIKCYGNLLTSVSFFSSFPMSMSLWTGASANITTRSGDIMTVSFTTSKTTIFMTPLKLIISYQSKPIIFSDFLCFDLCISNWEEIQFHPFPPARECVFPVWVSSGSNIPTSLKSAALEVKTFLLIKCQVSLELLCMQQ